MTEFLRWLLVLEVVGVAFLPLTAWLLRRLPDAGYPFAKILGLVLLTYLTWTAGNLLPVGAGAAFPALVVVVGATAGWWFLGEATLDALRSRRRLIALEEGLFLAALVVWGLLRAHYFHPAIAHTEQYMDMAFLNAAAHSSTFPPYDPWMSGHAINYYYFGYLAFATVINLSAVPVAVGYNLALCTLFASTLVAAFSLGYALTRRVGWSLLAPLFVGLLGNWHGVVQLFQGHPPSEYFWFWGSTRVVGGQIGYTINEFPFFSFMLGDLHPHVMALPVTLLVLAIAYSVLLAPEKMELRLRGQPLAWLLLASVCVGSLFTINSWDFPTYLVVLWACVGANAYLRDASSQWWREAVVACVALGLTSVALFVSFYLQFKSLAHGVGLVTTPSLPLEFVQVFGLPLLVLAMFLVLMAYVLQPADEAGGTVEEESSRTEDSRRFAELGALSLRDPSYILLTVVLIGCALVLGSRLGLWTLMLILAFGITGFTILQRVLNTEEPNSADAVALILAVAACGVLALTEVIYLRDSFDGSSSYRMNTVFKFYYQAWVLLGVAGAYGVYRIWSMLRSQGLPRLAWAAVVVAGVGTGMSAYYTVAAPSSAAQGGTDDTLNGMAWLRTRHPGDFAAVGWLRGHASHLDVELEAAGPEYDPDYARIATFSAIPTVMGWAGHEGQWRGADPEIGRRAADVNAIYETANISRAIGLLHRYHVRFVVVGDTERLLPGAQVQKFCRFMVPAFRSNGTIIYTWR